MQGKSKTSTTAHIGQHGGPSEGHGAEESQTGASTRALLGGGRGGGRQVHQDALELRELLENLREGGAAV